VSGPLRIVLLTFEGLRLDALAQYGGDARLTPNLSHLAAEADFVGVGIAASSFPPASLASIFTGLQPWRHGVMHAAAQDLPSAQRALAEALRDQGFHTEAWRDLLWLQEGRRGFDQGFDTFRWLLNLRRLGDSLSVPPARDEFFWIGLRRPSLPYERDARLFEQVDQLAPINELAALPERLGYSQVADWFDPDSQMAPGLSRKIQLLHAVNLARADRVLGAILEQLRAADDLRSTLLVVTSTNGESLADPKPAGNVWSGSLLTPEQVAVPVLVKLPDTLVDRSSGSAQVPFLLPPHGSVLRLADLSTTVQRWAGGWHQLAPEAFPVGSTWSDNPSGPILSELYLRDGSNQVALYEGDRFLLRTERFAVPPPGSWRRRMVGRIEPELIEAWRDHAPLSAGFGTTIHADCEPPRCAQQNYRWPALRTGGTSTLAAPALRWQPTAGTDLPGRWARGPGPESGDAAVGVLEAEWIRRNGPPRPASTPGLGRAVHP
jgi:hypothetical protein